MYEYTCTVCKYCKTLQLFTSQQLNETNRAVYDITKLALFYIKVEIMKCF